MKSCLSIRNGVFFGGKDFDIEKKDVYIMFAVITENIFFAQNAVKQYRKLLIQNGVCYHCDTKHCFEVDSYCSIKP